MSAAQAGSTPPEFALEGSVFIGGAVVQWLRDGLRHPASHEVQALAESVPDAGGVAVVPAFTGWARCTGSRCARRDRRPESRHDHEAHRARGAGAASPPERGAALLQAMDHDARAGGGAAVSELRGRRRQRQRPANPGSSEAVRQPRAEARCHRYLTTMPTEDCRCQSVRTRSWTSGGLVGGSSKRISAAVT